MEALLDSALISANLDYASHPAFQQLLQAGIQTSTVTGWFSEIIKNGTDPFTNSKIFMSQLGGKVRQALGDAPDEEPAKYMMFSGPSASGKTSLIMKLCTHHTLLADRSLCVVNIEPRIQKTGRYYTVLEPFCADMEVPYYSVSSGKEITSLLETLEGYDHILIDTPSLPAASEDGFRSFWKLRQLLTPLAPLEIHYVVNAASSRLYLDKSASVHHPLQPDYIDITHLDEVDQWGPVIPFLGTMGCKTRYISTGNSPSTLSEFNPQWFIQKVIQE
jgi:flagellar biosynthesis protein FlhF